MEIKIIDLDKWQEIFNTLKKQKLRTALTAFGVFWGIFMLVILLGFGTGYGIKVDALFGDNKNVLFIWPSSKTQLPYKGIGKGRDIVLTEEDVNLVKKKLPHVKSIEGQNWLSGPQRVIHEQESSTSIVFGSHAGWEKIQNVRIVAGRYLNPLDEQEFRKVAVIGTKVRDVLFKHDPNPIGKLIDIQGISFQVIGVYISTSPDINDRFRSNTVIIPNNGLRKAFNQMDRLGELRVEPMSGYSAAEIEKDVKKIIYERQKIHPEDTGVLQTWNNEEDYQQRKHLVSGIVGFAWLVAIGTIIAGVIGVGNIMLVVVKERTREIGLRKALGATPKHISLMIVQESLLITLVAGYIGLAAGVFLLEGITAVLIKLGKAENMFASPYIDIGNALMALAVLVIAGALASVLPAIKAASVNPITALQDE